MVSSLHIYLIRSYLVRDLDTIPNILYPCASIKIILYVRLESGLASMAAEKRAIDQAIREVKRIESERKLLKKRVKLKSVRLGVLIAATEAARDGEGSCGDRPPAAPAEVHPYHPPCRRALQ